MTKALKMSLIKSSERLIEAAHIVNNVDSMLLTKIVKRLCQDCQVQQAFSAQENEKLCEALSLDEKKLLFLLSSLSFVIQEAAYHIMKPAQFSDNLNAIGFNNSSSAIISELWASHAKSIIETKRKESIAPLKVDSVESSLHFQLSSQTEGQVKTPLGLLHLNLNVDPNEPKSTLTIEFTHSELLSFYQILENIQDQLDNIM